MNLPYIDIHSHLHSDSREIISHPTLSAINEDIFTYPYPFWCGVHPCEYMDSDTIIERLERVASNIIGIGEIGLDKFCGTKNQKHIYLLQLHYAFEKGLPITIHSVRMHNEIITSLRGRDCSKVIIHSFVGSNEIANEYLKLGCSLSFGGVSLNSTRSVEVLKNIPKDRLFIESDDKGNIREYYDMAATLMNIEIDSLKEIINSNYRCLIG